MGENLNDIFISWGNEDLTFSQFYSLVSKSEIFPQIHKLENVHIDLNSTADKRMGQDVLIHWSMDPADVFLKYLEAQVSSFRKAFLNYTEKYPNHWICRDRLAAGYLDLPHNGAVLFSACLLHMEEKRQLGDILIPYAEFLGAMQPATSIKEIPFAFIFIFLTSVFFPEFSSLQQMKKRYIEMNSDCIVSSNGLSTDMAEWNDADEPGQSLCFIQKRNNV